MRKNKTKNALLALLSGYDKQEEPKVEKPKLGPKPSPVQPIMPKPVLDFDLDPDLERRIDILINQDEGERPSRLDEALNSDEMKARLASNREEFDRESRQHYGDKLQNEERMRRIIAMEDPDYQAAMRRVEDEFLRIRAQAGYGIPRPLPSIPYVQLPGASSDLDRYAKDVTSYNNALITYRSHKESAERSLASAQQHIEESPSLINRLALRKAEEELAALQKPVAPQEPERKQEPSPGPGPGPVADQRPPRGWFPSLFTPEEVGALKDKIRDVSGGNADPDAIEKDAQDKISKLKQEYRDWSDLANELVKVDPDTANASSRAYMQASADVKRELDELAKNRTIFNIADIAVYLMMALGGNVPAAMHFLISQKLRRENRLNELKDAGRRLDINAGQVRAQEEANIRGLKQQAALSGWTMQQRMKASADVGSNRMEAARAIQNARSEAEKFKQDMAHRRLSLQETGLRIRQLEGLKDGLIQQAEIFANVGDKAAASMLLKQAGELEKRILEQR